IGCAEMGTSPNSRIVRAASREVTELPSPDVVRPAVPTATRVAAEENRLPINLDTVFHLAEEQNSQVALARARVQEACAAKDIAATSWLPSLNVGTTYFRHEGGIANENGTITRSSFGT